jgi:hypothetical protein
MCRDHEEPAGAGTSLLLGSFKALELSFEATHMEVKPRYKSLAQI